MSLTGHHPGLLSALLFYAPILVASRQQLPYIPSRLLVDSSTSPYAYLFQQSSSYRWQLAKVDLTKTLSASTSLLSDANLLDDALPFITSGGDIDAAFNAAIDPSGAILVWTGSCADTNSSLWLYRDKSWSQLPIDSQSGQAHLPSPRFLSTSVLFANSSTNSGPVDCIYTFGGMCPMDSTNSVSETNWISTAIYADDMYKLSVANLESPPSTVLGELVSAKRPPLAQAGHSLTPLIPAFSAQNSRSKMSSSLLKQDFVLIGGHTQSAFLNLSQISIYSLPAELWSFASVDTPSDVAMSLTPRSGHSATLSSDGAQIVVFGGWVGDVNTPASPQMLILNIADTFGGSGSWRWTIPNSSGPTIASPGLYGHAALTLPGNILAVTGGYTIHSTSLRKRQLNSLSRPNTQAFFYNLTSHTWISSYNAPSSSFVVHRGVLSSPAAKAGLGLGIALAIIAILVAIFTFLWFKRRQRWKKEHKQDELRAKQGFVSDEWGMGDDNKVGHLSIPYLPPSSIGGVYNGITSSTRGQFARPHHNRYTPGSDRLALTGDDRLPRRQSGRSPYPYERSLSRRDDTIHTIAEKDEESSEIPVTIWSVVDEHGQGGDDDDIAPVIGRVDPALEVESWAQGWRKAGEKMFGVGDSEDEDGRLSPSKSVGGRSFLSDSSTVYHKSTTATGTVSNIVRSLSLKLNPFGSQPTTQPLLSTASRSPKRDGNEKVVGQSEVNKHMQRNTGPQTCLIPVPRDTIQHIAPRRKVVNKRSQSANRLGSGLLQSMCRAIGISNQDSKHDDDDEDDNKDKSSPTRANTTGKTLATTRRSSISPDDRQDTAVSTSASLRGIGEGPVLPRRSASDAAFWKEKRGARDWGAIALAVKTAAVVPVAEAGPVIDNDVMSAQTTVATTTTAAAAASKRDSYMSEWSEAGPGNGGNDSDGYDEEWDVEMAAETRVVQVVFTMPKVRLRVVNVDSDSRSLASVGEGATA